MAKNYQGGPVGLGTIAVGVGEEEHTLEEVHEPFLIQEGSPSERPKVAFLLPKVGKFLVSGMVNHPFPTRWNSCKAELLFQEGKEVPE